MSAKLILMALVLATAFMWMFTGVTAEGELLRSGTSDGTSGVIALVSLALTAVTLWRIFALRLAGNRPAETARPSTPLATPARTISQDIV